jgi:hypothetical protein
MSVKHLDCRLISRRNPSTKVHIRIRYSARAYFQLLIFIHATVPRISVPARSVRFHFDSRISLLAEDQQAISVGPVAADSSGQPGKKCNDRYLRLFPLRASRLLVHIIAHTRYAARVSREESSRRLFCTVKSIFRISVPRWRTE